MQTGPLLVFENCIDKPYATFVRLPRGASVAPRWTASIKDARGIPMPADRDADVVDYFSARSGNSPQLFHIGHPDRSVKAIRGDYELRRSLAHELATNRSLRNLLAGPGHPHAPPPGEVPAHVSRVSGAVAAVAQQLERSAQAGRKGHTARAKSRGNARAVAGEVAPRGNTPAGWALGVALILALQRLSCAGGAGPGGDLALSFGLVVRRLLRPRRAGALIAACWGCLSTVPLPTWRR